MKRSFIWIKHWLIKLNDEFKIEKDFTIPFDEEKVKEQIGEGKTLDYVLKNMGQVVEGATTLKAG